LRELEEHFARKDFLNGDFYFRRGAYDSAILYFRHLIASYPSATAVPDAFVRLVEAYRAIGYREEQEETCAHLRQYFGGRDDVRRVCGDGSTGR
jgi:outer membrane protein assembly factor BamD (BamD/ComL family)